MYTNLTGTCRTLYNQILLNPTDNGLRLVFADALEDGAGEEDCPAGCCIPSPRKDGIYRVYDSAGPDSRWVKCSTCSGSSRVSNGHAELAEFVRVGVELERATAEYGPGWHPGSSSGRYPCDCRICTLRARESQLLAQHGDGWRRGARCDVCEGSSKIFNPACHEDSTYRCRKCHGTGYTSPLLRIPRVFATSKFIRGLIGEIECVHAEAFTESGPSEWVCEVIQAFPIQEIRLSDFQAWEDEEGWYIGTDSIDGPRLGFGVARLAINLAEKNCVEYPFRTQALAEHYQALAVAQIVRTKAFSKPVYF